MKAVKASRLASEGSRFSESCNPDVVVVPCSAELYLQSIVIISRAPTPAKQKLKRDKNMKQRYMKNPVLISLISILKNQGSR